MDALRKLSWAVELKFSHDIQRDFSLYHQGCSESNQPLSVGADGRFYTASKQEILPTAQQYVGYQKSLRHAFQWTIARMFSRAQPPGNNALLSSLPIAQPVDPNAAKYSLSFTIRPATVGETSYLPQERTNGYWHFASMATNYAMQSCRFYVIRACKITHYAHCYALKASLTIKVALVFAILFGFSNASYGFINGLKQSSETPWLHFQALLSNQRHWAYVKAFDFSQKTFYAKAKTGAFCLVALPLAAKGTSAALYAVVKVIPTISALVTAIFLGAEFGSWAGFMCGYAASQAVLWTTTHSFMSLPKLWSMALQIFTEMYDLITNPNEEN